MEKPPQQEKSKQQIEWEERLIETDKIVDGLGKGIDENIKETVATFNIHGFITSASCEGHIGEITDEGRTHGVPYPWIDLYTPEPKNWKEDEKKQKEWTIDNFTQQQKMMNMLEEFYKDRQTPFNARLTFKPIGIYGGFRLQSFGADMTTILSSEEQLAKFELYRKEMADFTEFLKNKHLSHG